MPHIASRRAALQRLGALSVGTLGTAWTLAGCSAEPRERKAFIEFLQTRVLNRQRASIPKLNEEQRKAVGRYAAHYDIITGFNKEMSDAPFTAMMARLEHTRSLSQLMAKRKEAGELRDHLPQAAQDVKAALDRATAAKTALSQPDDLRAVYDAAFDKLVAQPAGLMLQLLPATRGMLGAFLELLTYVETHPNEVTIAGSTVEARSQASLNKVNALLKKVETESAAVGQLESAIRKLTGR
ncbi:DUF3053 family protein [Paracidovorax sp. MALMAid1276]|uniref:DUF3053 family protein n=1 Tax=Paracidovorax sp. MALMAid1276 TaxID=3411631 RepID=UPI003B9B5BB7